jgi:hypothetical protein
MATPDGAPAFAVGEPRVFFQHRAAIARHLMWADEFASVGELAAAADEIRDADALAAELQPVCPGLPGL